jgi:hypothetical protein
VDTITSLPVANNSTVGTGDMLHRDISIYPNPSSGLIRIESDETIIRSVEILDITGKQVLRKDFDTPQQSIELDLNISPGLYIIKVREEKFIYVTEILIK